MAAPRKYSSVQLEKAIDKYFDACANEETMPNLYGLFNYLHICRETWHLWATYNIDDDMDVDQDAKADKVRVIDVVKNTRERLTAEAVKFAVANPKSQVFIMALMSTKGYGQAVNDGNSTAQKDVNINVSLNGTKADPFA